MFQVNEGLMQLPFDLISKCVKSINATHQHAADEVVKIMETNTCQVLFIHIYVFFLKNKLFFVPI